MSKRRPYRDKNQPSLFDFSNNFTIGTVNINQGHQSEPDGSRHELSSFEFGLCQILKTVLDDASKRERDPLDRVEIAIRMSKRLGREITKSHIDGWVAMSAVERRIHVDSMKILCEVVNDFRPMHYFVEQCGFKALEPYMAACAEYGAKTALMERLKTESKNLKDQMDDPKLLERLLSSLSQGGEL